MKAIATMPGAGEPDSRREGGMSEKLTPSQRLFKLVTGPGEDVYRAVDLLDIAHAMADEESKLALAEAELDALGIWKRTVDEALNSGDGTYRP